jgi:hypothetical protein
VSTSPRKPARLEVIAANVPECLRRLKRWVLWRWKKRKGSWDKPPLQLDGSFASVDDPSTWTTFDDALAAHLRSEFDGIGFVLGYVAEEDVTYTGVDLDDCRDPLTGEVSEWACAHLNGLSTYAEVSPSGKGVKAIVLGKLPGPDRNESARLGVEMYSGRRYFTLTGHLLPGAISEVEERSDRLAELYYQLFGRATGLAGQAADRPSDRELALSALDGLHPSLAANYWDWLRVGMALHSVGADREMLEAWDRWSRQCEEKYQSGACERKWQSFGKRGGLGLGSLIHWARSNGWSMPKSDRRVESSARADGPILERLDAVLDSGAEALFRDTELLDALARLAETDPGEFACLRAKARNAKIPLRSLDATLAPARQIVRSQRPRPESAETYRIAGGRIIHQRMTREGPTEVPLCNFSARIVEVVTRDDGIEQTAVFTVDGALADGRPLPRLLVPSADFQRLDWVTTGWHGEAVVYAGSGTRDHARCAIELLSRDRLRRLQYLHTGWRQIGGDWLFLHAGGAIGASGTVTGVEVDLPGALGLVRLPDPPTEDELIRVVRASLELLSIGPARVTFPLLSAVYRAPLGDVDFSLHLAGASGVFKSELAALAQQHYGSSLNSRSLPGSWLSTENALEELAFAAKDILVVIDDFKPGGTPYEVSSYHRKADRLFRAVGNHAGRQRLTREGKLRPDHRPRGLVCSTGEEIPRGESLRARLFISDISQGEICRDRLTRCQGMAAEGKFAAAMSGYLRWLAPRYPEVRRQLNARRDEFRAHLQAEIGDAHARSPGILADLVLGTDYFLHFAQDIGAVDEAERQAALRQCRDALLEGAAVQSGHVRAAEPTDLYFRLLIAGLASGRVHLAGLDGRAPPNPSAWGWREGGDPDHLEWRAQGHRIGWVDAEKVEKVGLVGLEHVYLEPEAAHAAAEEMARLQGESLGISARTLRQRLRDRDLLASTDAGRKVLTVRRVLQGCRREVVHVRAHCLHPQPDQPDPRGEGPSHSGSCGGRDA